MRKLIYMAIIAAVLIGCDKNDGPYPTLDRVYSGQALVVENDEAGQVLMIRHSGVREGGIQVMLDGQIDLSDILHLKPEQGSGVKKAYVIDVQLLGDWNGPYSSLSSFTNLRVGQNKYTKILRTSDRANEVTQFFRWDRDPMNSINMWYYAEGN